MLPSEELLFSSKIFLFNYCNLIWKMVTNAFLSPFQDFLASSQLIDFSCSSNLPLSDKPQRLDQPKHYINNIKNTKKRFDRMISRASTSIFNVINKTFQKFIVYNRHQWKIRRYNNESVMTITTKIRRDSTSPENFR